MRRIAIVSISIVTLIEACASAGRALERPAVALVVNEKNQQTARAAWMKAVSLAKERNAGKTCETDAYEWTILAELGVAVSLSPYLKNEVATGKSDSAKALRRALAGNLMLYDLMGKMSTPQLVAQAMVGTVWYSNDGGVMGSLSILQIEKNQVRELVLDSETYKRRSVIWAYSFNPTTGKLTLSKGMTTRRYKLEKITLESDFKSYQLTNAAANEVNYSNEPDDCSA
jgi:hypothetical protein